MSSETPKKTNPETIKSLSELEAQLDAFNWEGATVHDSGVPVVEVEKGPLEPKDINRQLEQMDRLRDTRKHMREEKTDIGHTEMMAKNEDYKKIQTKIIAIRKRLAEIAVKGEGGEKVAEVQKLRDELAQHFKAFRNFTKEQKAAKPEEPRVESETNDPYAHLSEEEKINAKNWEGLSSALTEQVERVDEAGAKLNEVWAHGESQETQSTPDEKEPSQPKAYQERLALRNEWKAKKEIFDEAYRSYIEDAAKRKTERTMWDKFQFWKKENKPDSLLQLETDYQNARKMYASSLNEAITQKIEGEHSDVIAGKKEIALQAALANRFVLQAAHDRLKAEKEFIPEAQGKRVYEKMQAILQKHGKAIKIAGYATVGLISLGSGGVAGAVAALAGKAIQTKLTAGAMAVGASGGALAGNVVGDYFVGKNAEKRDNAMLKARRSFSVDSLTALESQYLNAYRGHEQAVRNKKNFILGGTALGAIAGAAVAGNLEEVGDALPSPDIPDTEPQIPPEPTPVPETTPDDVAPSETEQETEPEDTEYPPEKLDGDEKGDAFMNPSQESDTPDEGQEYHTSPDEPILEEEESEEFAPQPIEYTFERGGNVSTALFETWKENSAVLEDQLSKKEFLAEMYTAIAEIEKDPIANAELMEQMGISSGDIDKVQEGQTINLRPFFEYLNDRN